MDGALFVPQGETAGGSFGHPHQSAASAADWWGHSRPGGPSGALAVGHPNSPGAGKVPFSAGCPPH